MRMSEVSCDTLTIKVLVVCPTISATADTDIKNDKNIVTIVNVIK